MDFFTNILFRKISLLVILLFFSGLLSQAQYSPFYSSERNLEEYPGFQAYQKIISDFNQNKDFDRTIEALDIMAEDAWQGQNYYQFLFLKNEVANFYLSSNNFDNGFSDIVNTMQLFASKADTLNLEYVVSYRILRGLSRRTSAGALDEGLLFANQLGILRELEITGEPYINTLVDYGLYLLRERKVDEAVQTLYQARTSALIYGDFLSLAVADYTLIANINMDFDLRQTVMDVLKNDLELLEGEDPSNPILFYSSYFNYVIGERYYFDFQNIDSAIKYTTNAISTIEDVSFPMWNLLASCHSNMALIYAELKDTTLLWEHYIQAKIIAANQPMSDYNRTLAFVNIAEASLAASTDSVFVLLEEIMLQPGADSFNEKIIELQARAFVKKGDFQTAIDFLTLQFSQHRIVNGHKIPLPSLDLDPLYQVKYISLMEKAFRSMERNSGKDFREIILAFISVQNKLYLNMMQQDVFGLELSGLQTKYHDFVMPSLEYLFSSGNNENDQKQILEMIFSSKTIQLISNMIKSRQMAILEKSDLFSRMSEIAFEIQNIRNQLNRYNEPEDDRNLKVKLNNLLVENMILRNSMQKEQNISLEQVIIPSSGQIQEKLSDGEAIIEYCINGPLLMYVFITPNEVKTNIRYIENLQDLISRDLFTIKTGGRNSNLGSFLFEDIEEELKSLTHLTIIPDKDLNFLPFEWLKLPTSGTMIIEKMSVSYSYSVSLWYLLIENYNHKAEGDILAVAPLYFSQQNHSFKASSSQSALRNKHLSPLYQSKEEVEGIRDVFSERSPQVRNLIEGDATKLNLVNELPTASIIHLATHAHVDLNTPEHSGLYLYNEKPGEDNFLSLGELMNLNLVADLAVLSACNTGKGDFVRGEGVMALPRAFIFAGVPNVIASLWKVQDERTRDLMLSFYHYLSLGESYRQALHQAKLDSIEKGFLPLDWAGFILIGK